jgi:Eukaryotic initiation factor 4E
MVISQTDLTMASESNTTSTNKLKDKWNLWSHLPHDPDWSVNSYKKIYKFTNIEETIAITESLPEALVKNCMLFVMREGIIPMWEDPKNRNGGCFSYKVSNKHVYEVWRDLTYVLVGETISINTPFVNSVTGITISPKKNFCIVKIWMTNCDHQNPSVVTNDIKNLLPQGCLFKKHTPEF